MTPTSSIKELNIAITTRLLLDKLSRRGEIRSAFQLEELAANTTYATNELLKDMGCVGVWARKRGTRVYVMHEQCHRIICEVAILADKDSDGLYHNPKVALVNLRGIIPDSVSFASLIEAVANLGVRSFKRKDNNV